MIKVTSVRFKKAGKIYYFDPDVLDPKEGQFVIVETAIKEINVSENKDIMSVGDSINFNTEMRQVAGSDIRESVQQNAKIIPMDALMLEKQDLDVAKQTIDQEIEALRSMESELNISLTKVLDLLQNTKGRVIVTGMGKSGHIASKISATMASTGTPAPIR